MKKKTIVLIIVAVILIGCGIGGYYAYKAYMHKIEPNTDIATMPVAPVVTTKVVRDLAEPNSPKYSDLEATATGLYPTLSGAYESIWDDYEEYPIDILAGGEDTSSSTFKLIWTKSYLYLQVKVLDTTPDVSGENYQTQDSVSFFLNEDGNKNSTLTVGDSCYFVNRDNAVTLGFGASTNFESVSYEIYDDDNNDIGYIVEAAIPLLTIKASKNSSVGFDIMVVDATEGNILSIRKWASNYLYDFQNFSALGTITFK